jgi:hypothetical protein
MAKTPPPPPPPPPPPKAKKGPPPPPKAKKAPPPPKPKKAAPPPPPPPSKAEKPPAPAKKRPPSSKPTKRRRKGTKKGPPPGRGKKSSSAPKKKGRRIRIKLGLRQNRLTKEEDTYHDQVGWTVSQEVLEPLDAVEEKHKPEVVNHQCSMCGSIMQIPQPKRERYKVICAYSECGHEDMIGI